MLKENQIPQGMVKYLVIARDVKYLGEIHDAYTDREEAERALAHYFEIGASSGEMYECKLIPEREFSQQ